MKIVFLMVYGDIGGAELVALQHSIIAKKNNLDFKVISASMGSITDKMIENGIEVVYCKELLNDDRQKHLEKHIKNADVVYNCNFWAITPQISKLKEKYNFKYITIVHSNIDWVFQQLQPYDKITDLYLATHDLIKKELLSHGYLEDKIVLVTNCIDTTQIQQTNDTIKSELREKLGIPKEDLVIGMSTRINYDKNVNDIVKIMDRVNKYIPCSFVLIGDACYNDESHTHKEKLLKSISESLYKDKFYLLGRLPELKEVYNWQRVFDVAINTSPSEGTPMSLLEQMCAGIYCIYPSIGGIPELINGYGSVLPIRQRLTIEEQIGPNVYTEEEIGKYVIELYKYSKTYRDNIGDCARKHIIKTRDISTIENSIVNFLQAKKVKVSILLTTYNSNIEHLKECVDSLLSQTHDDFELVIVDDCSSNKDVITTLKNYSQHDNRIKVFLKEENSGIGYTINYGLCRCSGDLIIKMDHDDIARPNLIKTHVEYFNRFPDTVACGCQLQSFGVVNMVTNHPETITKEYVLNKQDNWILNHPGFAFKKETMLSVGGYSDERNICEDFNVYCRILAKGYVIKNHSEILIDYRSHSGSYTYEIYKTKKYNDSIIESRRLLGIIKNPIVEIKPTIQYKYSKKIKAKGLLLKKTLSVLKEKGWIIKEIIPGEKTTVKLVK